MGQGIEKASCASIDSDDEEASETPLPGRSYAGIWVTTFN
jgi:hypothetical protein